MADHLLHILKAGAREKEIRGKGMPQIVEAEIFYFGPFQARPPGPIEILKRSTVYGLINNRLKYAI
jgi:hypothetical protein